MHRVLRGLLGGAFVLVLTSAIAFMRKPVQPRRSAAR